MKIFYAAFDSGSEFLEHLQVGDDQDDQSVASLSVATKARFEEGEPIILEIGFPGLANRILVRGVVLAPAEGGDVQRFAFEEGEEHKRDFLIAVASEKATLSWSRKHRRFPLRVPARFVVEGKTDEKLTIEGDGHIEDVGSGGASIKTTEPLPDGAKVTVELDSGDGLGKIEFTGKVVWSEKDDASAGIGIQFERLGGDEMKQLRRMIRDVKIHGKTIEGSD